MKNDYKESIRELLVDNHQPLDVEKIRVACGIGNWQTALKHCLELLHDKKIRGVKTSKSWVFWVNPTGSRTLRLPASGNREGGDSVIGRVTT